MFLHSGYSLVRFPSLESTDSLFVFFFLLTKLLCAERKRVKKWRGFPSSCEFDVNIENWNLKKNFVSQANLSGIIEKLYSLYTMMQSAALVWLEMLGVQWRVCSEFFVSDGTASGRSVICDVGTLATGLEKEGCAEAWIFTDFNSVKAFAYSVSQCEIECNSWSGF
jgi:hypothetical protein